MTTSRSQPPPTRLRWRNCCEHVDSDDPQRREGFVPETSIIRMTGTVRNSCGPHSRVAAAACRTFCPALAVRFIHAVPKKRAGLHRGQHRTPRGNRKKHSVPKRCCHPTNARPSLRKTETAHDGFFPGEHPPREWLKNPQTPPNHVDHRSPSRDPQQIATPGRLGTPRGIQHPSGHGWIVQCDAPSMNNRGAELSE